MARVGWQGRFLQNAAQYAESIRLASWYFLRIPRQENVMRFFIFPGDRAADLVGLEEGSEHRQVFRMFANTVIWGAIGVTMAFLFFA